MTSTDKPTTRETRSYHRGRAIIIKLCPTWVEIRLKKKKHVYTVTYDQLFTLGAMNEAKASRLEKLAKKKEAKADKPKKYGKLQRSTRPDVDSDRGLFE